MTSVRGAHAFPDIGEQLSVRLIVVYFSIRVDDSSSKLPTFHGGLAVFLSLQEQESMVPKRRRWNGLDGHDDFDVGMGIVFLRVFLWWGRNGGKNARAGV